MIKRINELIKDIGRNGPLIGIGRPEILKYRKAYSRRITDEHRLVYSMDSNGNLMMITDETSTLKLCKHCGKIFVASRSNVQFCSPQCKNQHNVYKCRTKKEDSE